MFKVGPLEMAATRAGWLSATVENTGLVSNEVAPPCLLILLSLQANFVTKKITSVVSAGQDGSL